MNSDEFRNSPAGYLAPTENSRLAFVPNALPPTAISLDPIVRRIASAHTLLGRLSGFGHRFTGLYNLLRPLQNKEAVSSSGIEGTFTTLPDLMMFQMGVQNVSRPADTRETLNYLDALQSSVDSLATVPISTRLFLAAHKTLLKDADTARGGNVEAGKFKRNQNYIQGKAEGAIRFIPSPPGMIERLMSDLENFVNSEASDRFPPLVTAALVHYQFETIHPFPDGNGRVGRLLIPLVLIQKNALNQPLLFMSPAIERNKNEYVDALYEVSRRGAWIEWIDFFLKMAETSCEKTIRICEDLYTLEETYQRKVQEPRVSILLRDLIRSIFEWPAITIPYAAQRLNVSYQAAKYNVDKMVTAGILTEYRGGGRPKVYLAPEIIDILERPW